jgi:glucose/arabinose dehydrogenase
MTRRAARTTAVAATAFALAATMTQADAGEARSIGTDRPSSTASKAPARKIVARNLNVPWGLVFLPKGKMLVGGRDNARILVVRPNGKKSLARKVRGVHSNGSAGGEGGLLGLAKAPNFSRNHWLYAYITAARDNRIIRMKWNGRHLGGQHLVLKGIPKSIHHNGGRIAFGPDGMLYATTGEAEVPMRAQRKRNLGGKILRMTPTGKPAPGNPLRRSVVWSWGHRNVEGLDWDSNGRLWATEFGEHKVDELNLIRKGHNYGWPIVEGRSRIKRFTNPKTTWPTEAAGPSGIAITRVRGKTFAYIGGLTGHRLWRVQLAGNRVVARKRIFNDTFGRIRTTAVAHGDLWLTSSNTDGRSTPRRGDDKLIRVNLR